MKKNFLKVALVTAVAAMAGYGVYANQTKEMMSDVMLENVEALADREYDIPYRLFPCPGYGEGNECKTSTEDRPECGYITYCN